MSSVYTMFISSAVTPNLSNPLFSAEKTPSGALKSNTGITGIKPKEIS